MSLYTKQEKVKSLWHPITDEDFDIDFSKPFVVCTEEMSLFIVNGLRDLYESYMDEEHFFDFKAQILSEEGKEYFRENYYGYMYLDEDFYKAIEWAKGKYLEDVKGGWWGRTPPRRSMSGVRKRTAGSAASAAFPTGSRRRPPSGNCWTSLKN